MRRIIPAPVLRVYLYACVPGILGSAAYSGVQLFLHLRLMCVNKTVCQELLGLLPIEVSNYSCSCVA